MKPGGSAACQKGYIRRRASRRTRSSCIKNRGAPGRWQTRTGLKGIGPLRKGLLTSLGYSHTKKASARHKSLTRAIKKYGRTSTIRKLNAIRVYTRRTAPSASKTYTTDMHYVQKK
jgi:hypothetical protein